MSQNDPEPSLSDDILIRYLLGDSLTTADEERIDQACLANPEVLDRLMAAEAALMDDYVRGRLAPADHALFETNFALSKRRRRELGLRFAVKDTLATVASFPARIPYWRALPRRVLYGGIAAGLVLGTCVAVLGTEVWKLRARLEQVAREAPTPVEIALDLRPGSDRAESGARPVLTVSPSVRWVRLRLHVGSNGSYGSYRASLRPVEGETVVTLNGLVPDIGGDVDLSLPASLLRGRPGTYVVVLERLRETARVEPMRSYTLQVR